MHRDPGQEQTLHEEQGPRHQGVTQLPQPFAPLVGAVENTQTGCHFFGRYQPFCTCVLARVNHTLQHRIGGMACLAFVHFCLLLQRRAACFDQKRYERLIRQCLVTLMRMPIR